MTKRRETVAARECGWEVFRQDWRASFNREFFHRAGKNGLTGKAWFAIISNCLNTFLLDRRVSSDGTA